MRRYTAALLLFEYVRTCRGWLTSAPPGTVAPLNWMVPAPPRRPSPVPFVPPPPPGKKCDERSAVEIGGISSAAPVSRTAAAATLTAKRFSIPGSGGTRRRAQRACSASRCAPATTTSERQTAIASGSATLFGVFVLRIFVARTAKSGITASTPRSSRSAIQASQ